MKTILVTGAGGSASHNFIESLRLSKDKFRIIGTDINRYHIELSDVDRRYLIPECHDPRYLETLNRLIKREGIQFVHPQPDSETMELAKLRHEIKAKTFLPTYATLETCQDKMRTHDILEKNDVPVPESYVFDDAESMYQSISRLLDEHPKVWMRARKGAGSRAALPVTNFKQAHSWLQYWETTKDLGFDSFMVSEFLPGTDFAFTSVWKEGKLVTSAARQRIMYLYGFLSPSGTSSTPSVAKSVHDKSVNSICTRAVKAIDPNANGIFCVDLKCNSEGTPCVTEVNSGRFFTTSNFFTHAGSNMPLIYVKLGLGEQVKGVPQYDAVPENLYWVRMVDMGYKLLKEDEFKSKRLLGKPEEAH